MPKLVDPDKLRPVMVEEVTIAWQVVEKHRRACAQVQLALGVGGSSTEFVRSGVCPGSSDWPQTELAASRAAVPFPVSILEGSDTPA